MVPNRKSDLLDAGLPKAEQGLLSSLARGLRADREAIVATVQDPWSNRQAEAQITRLRILKRRCKAGRNAAFPRRE